MQWLPKHYTTLNPLLIRQDLVLDDYLGAVDWCISPEQGRAELNECESLERTGEGSEERWRRKTR